MGKIADALEKHKKEKSLELEKLEPLPRSREKVEDPEAARIREVAREGRYSPKLVVLSAPDSVDAENFKVLRARILLGGKSKPPPRTILVTSTFPGEGKTFVSSNLAFSIALGIDEHVLLVDCDLRRPQLCEMMGYPRSEGLAELLSGERRIPDLLVKTSVPKLSFLPAGIPPGNAAELLSSRGMEDFIEEVRSRYEDRFIILDGTPMQFTSETQVLASHVDGVLLVVRAERSPREAIQRAVQGIDKEKLLGVVFNGHSEAVKAYKKYYAGYYYR
ncbi:MAG: polysaccharide biosynthesis tyrosine autokinase [Desulfobacteraceae bacterium]